MCLSIIELITDGYSLCVAANFDFLKSIVMQYPRLAVIP